MKLRQSTILLFLMLTYLPSPGQDSNFNSFISRISSQYQVDIALAPELIPALDSIKNYGTEELSLDKLLHQILKDKHVTYQIVDGNKILLRRELEMDAGNRLVRVQGTVKDSRNQMPLAFAAIGIQNTTHGTYTNDKGEFTLYVDNISSTIQISYLGFKPVTIRVSELMKDQNSIEMEVDPVSLGQVTIVVPFFQMSSETNSQSLDLKGYQYISEDDVVNWNSEQLMNQINGYTRFSAEQGIRIRGSEEENSLIIMDGIPVYDPYHFYNIFSPYNGHYFPSVRFYKNNLPIEFGGRIDGMIDLNSTTLNKRSKFIFDTDLLLSSLAAEVAITKRIIFTAGGRISHTGSLKKSLIDSSTTNFSLPGKFRDENEWSSSQQPAFNFYDFNLGLTADLGTQTSITLSYFKSKDYLDHVIKSDVSTVLLNQEIISIKQSIESRDDWENEGFAMDFHTSLNENTILTINGFVSSFAKDISYNSLLKEQYPNLSRSSFNTGFQSSNLNSQGIKAFIHSQKEELSGYTIGVDFQHHEIDLLATENITPYLLEVQEEIESTLFGEYQQTFFNTFNVALGTRLTHLKSTSVLYIQPHIRVNYQIDDQWLLKSSFSKNIQSVREMTVENRFGREVDFLALSQPEAGYPVLKSDKFMLGGRYASTFISLDAELYFKKTDGLLSVRALLPDPSFQDETSPGEFYRLFSGEGWTAGLDFMAVYKYKKTETSISYTLSKISQQFDKLFNGKSFSPSEDRRHQIKLSSQFKMGSYVASGLFTYKTKAPYLSLIRLEGQGGIGMANQVAVFRYLDPYFSLDLALDYSFKVASHPTQIGVSLINVTNHKNVNDLQHIGRIPRAGMGGLFLTHETALLGRTFNMHFRFLLD